MHRFLLLLKDEHRRFFHVMQMCSCVMDKKTTLDDLWTKLNSVWNFLNFDLLELVIYNFDIEDLKHKMESYKHDLQLFRNSTRLCDFTECWPVHREPSPEVNVRMLRVMIRGDWNSFTLEDLDKVEGIIVRNTNLPKFALFLKDIKSIGVSNITCTWLIPESLFVTASDVTVGVPIIQTT